MPLALLLLDTIDRAGCRVVRAQAFGRCVVEDINQQGAALVGGSRGEYVEHLRNHANCDLVDCFSFVLLPEATEVHGV
ncbi:hypothetical protein D3C84_775440 [compost metagenome]